jgi:hypothetical protein
MKTTTTQDETFRLFFMERFGKLPENSHGYADEWVTRLNTGVAWVHADSYTRDALRKYYPQECPRLLNPARAKAIGSIVRLEE